MPECKKEREKRELEERFESDEEPDSGGGPPWKKIAGIGLVVIIVIGLVWITKPWQWNLNQGSGPTGGENQLENQTPGKQYQGTLFQYQASFQYLSSEDNGPITSKLFMIFPCPNVDNEPVVKTKKPIENTEWIYDLENVTWQLRAHYENNGENRMQVEIENNIPAEFVEPRDDTPWLPTTPFLNYTSHGPKIQFELTTLDDNALYQNEEAWIQAKFLVPDEKADEVTLANDQGKVWIAMHGYVGDNTKVVDGKAWVKLSKWTGTQFQTVFENSETEWESAQNEWQGYRLDA